MKTRRPQLSEVETRATEHALEQAADWVIRLDGGACSADDLAEFARWIDAGASHSAAFDRALATWRESSIAVRQSEALLRSARKAVRFPIADHDGGHRSWTSLAFAAALAVFAIGAVLHQVSMPQMPPPGTRYSTLVGEQRDVRLSDGSVLTLDTKTVVVERYTRDERRVDLHEGRVQFDVWPDRGRPFIVRAAEGTVVALGTRFQVRVGGPEAAVTLLHGAVRVVARAAGSGQHVAELRPGQSVRVAEDGHLGAVESADPKAAEAWLNGKVLVDDWTLRDFVAELNRYSMVQMRIDDPATGRIRISGVFQTRDRQDLDRLLEEGWGIRSRRIAENEILLTHR